MLVRVKNKDEEFDFKGEWEIFFCFNVKLCLEKFIIFIIYFGDILLVIKVFLLFYF